MDSVLLVEDEMVLGKLIKEALERKSFQVLWAKDGQEGYSIYLEHQPNLCILDVMLPLINGFTLAGMIRNISKDVPILFLTALSETSDVVQGFESGGNDYLRKPFSLEELQLRLTELLRRNHPKEHRPIQQESYKMGKYFFSPITQILKTDNETFHLSFKESELLRLLLINKNTLLNRKETLLLLWNDDNFFNARTMDVYIARLRKYLKHDLSLSIVNIRGLGFKLIEDHQAIKQR